MKLSSRRLNEMTKTGPESGPLSFIWSIMYRILRHREVTILAGIVSAYSIPMYFLTTARMQTLRSSAWDLGNYNQALFTFAHNGMLFYWTSDIPQNPSGSLFGGHFSPILALIAPIYFIYSRPEALLAIQSVVIGLSAVPVWLMAKNTARIPSASLRLTLVSVYLLQPALLGLNWFDFHPEAFIPLLYLLTAYFLLRRNFSLGGVFSILLLSTIEYAPLMLIMLSLTLAAGDLFRIIRRSEAQSAVRRLTPWFTLVCVSIFWLLLSISVIRFFNPHDPNTSGVTTSWVTLGADNLLQVPARVVMSPSSALAALLSDGTTKFYFLVILALPFAFLPLFSPKFWILSSPWLLPSLLSDSAGYYNVGLQYPSFIFPPLVLAFLTQIDTLQRTHRDPTGSFSLRLGSLLRSLRHWTSKIDLRMLIIASTMIALVLSNPLSSLQVATSPFSNYGFPSPSGKSATVSEFLTYIPESASVLTDYYIFPLVSSRPNAFTWPYVIDYPTIPFVEYMQSLTASSDYLLLDLETFQPYNAIILAYAQYDFGILGYADGLLLLERGYRGNPAVFKPYQETFTFSNLTLLEGRVADDSLSSSGKVFVTSGNATVPKFWRGPNVMLPPGEYNIGFRIKIDSPYAGHIVDLRTLAHSLSVKYDLVTIGRAVFQIIEKSNPSTSSQTLSFLDLNSTSLSQGVYQTISQQVTLNSFSEFEFTGDNVSSVVLSLDRVDVVETKPLAFYANLNLQYFNGTTTLFSSQSPLPAYEVTMELPTSDSESKGERASVSPTEISLRSDSGVLGIVEP